MIRRMLADVSAAALTIAVLVALAAAAGTAAARILLRAGDHQRNPEQ